MDTPTTNATILSREALLKVRTFASSLQCALVRRSPLYGLLPTLDERQHARDGLVLSCCLLGAAESCEHTPK